MPFAQIHMIEGRTEEQKKVVIEKVSQALVEATGAPHRQCAGVDHRSAQGKLGHCGRQRQRAGALKPSTWGPRSPEKESASSYGFNSC